MTHRGGVRASIAAAGLVLLLAVALASVARAQPPVVDSVYWVETDGLVNGLWRVDATLPPATYPVVAELFIDCGASGCSPFAVAFDPATGTVYMSTLGAILSKSADAGLSDPFTTVVSGLGTSSSFFINDIVVGGGFLYIAQASRLLRYDIDGTNQVILDTSLSYGDLKLDSDHGRLYWWGGSDLLHRMNADGSGSVDALSFSDVDDPSNGNFLYRLVTIDAFALDVENGILYFQSQDQWVRKSDQVVFAIRRNLRVASIDYASSGSVGLTTVGFLIEQSGLFSDLEIDLAEGRLYFTGKATPSLQNSTWRIETDGTNLEQLSFDYGIRDDAGQRRMLALASSPAPVPVGGPLVGLLIVTGLGVAGAAVLHRRAG